MPQQATDGLLFAVLIPYLAKPLLTPTKRVWPRQSHASGF